MTVNNGQPLLEVKGLVTRFFTEDGVVKAVDGVDFHVNKVLECNTQERAPGNAKSIV